MNLSDLTNNIEAFPFILNDLCMRVMRQQHCVVCCDHGMVLKTFIKKECYFRYYSLPFQAIYALDNVDFCLSVTGAILRRSIT